MRLCGIRALALSQGLSSCPARPKSATGHGARLTVSAISRHRRTTVFWQPKAAANGSPQNGRVRRLGRDGQLLPTVHFTPFQPPEDIVARPVALAAFVHDSRLCEKAQAFRPTRAARQKQ